MKPDELSISNDYNSCFLLRRNSAANNHLGDIVWLIFGSAWRLIWFCLFVVSRHGKRLKRRRKKPSRSCKSGTETMRPKTTKNRCDRCRSSKCKRRPREIIKHECNRKMLSTIIKRRTLQKMSKRLKDWNRSVSSMKKWFKCKGKLRNSKLSLWNKW